MITLNQKQVEHIHQDLVVLHEILKILARHETKFTTLATHAYYGVDLFGRALEADKQPKEADNGR